MPCVFAEQDVKIAVDARKLLLLKRRARKSVEKGAKVRESRTFYLPIRQNEIQYLGLSEDSYVKAEIARLQRNDTVERPAYEIQAELDRLKANLKKILSEYDDDTSIRKSILMPKMLKILGEESIT